MSHYNNTPSCTHELSEISVEFFHAIYEKPSLRSSCYHHLYTHKMCEKYDEVTEILLQDSEAIAMLTDEQIYHIQQTWINVINSRLSEIFNNNPDLMQRWHKGYEISKLHAYPESVCNVYSVLGLARTHAPSALKNMESGS